MKMRDNNSVINEDLVYHEMETCIRQCKKNESPGQDKIHYEMIQNLPKCSKKTYNPAALQPDMGEQATARKLEARHHLAIPQSEQRGIQSKLLSSYCPRIYPLQADGKAHPQFPDLVLEKEQSAQQSC